MRGGIGLGLTLARGIVDAHKGRIRAESGGLSKGANLVVSLPRHREGDANEPRRAPPCEGVRAGVSSSIAREDSG